MKLKNAFLAFALSFAVIVPLTACDDTSANIKSQKETAIANMNANAVGVLGSEIIDFYSNLNVPVNADSSYIDTYQEAYDLISRFPDIQSKLNMLFESTSAYFGSAENLEELYMVQDNFLDDLYDLLRYTETSKLADLAWSINAAKNYLQENYAKLSPSNYSAKAFAQLEGLHDDILKAINTEKDYRVIDALVNNMDLVLPIADQQICAQGWIDQIEDNLSDIYILYTYYENMPQVQALKNTAILAIKQATTDAEMEAIFNQLFIDVDKIEEYGADDDMEQQYLIAYGEMYKKEIDFLMQQEFVSTLPEYWGANWAQLVAQTAKMSIDKAQSETEIQVIYSDFFVAEINYICNDYFNFIDEMNRANEVLARVNNAEVIMTEDNKAGFDALVMNLQEILDQTEDWDMFYALLKDNDYILTDAFYDKSIPEFIADLIENYYNAYSFPWQIFTVLHSNYFFYVDNAESYKESYEIYDKEIFGEAYFYNSIEDIMSADFTEDQVVPFGVDKIDVLLNEFNENIANVFVQLYGLTEEEATALVGVLSPYSNVFENVAQNKIGFMEAQSPEYKGVEKILAQPEKLAETQTQMLAFGTDFAKAMYYVNNLTEDLVVGLQTLLDQIKKDFNENTTYLPYLEDLVNFSEKTSILEMLIDYFQFSVMEEDYDSYQDFVDTYNMALGMYRSVLNEFYLADDALINNLPTAQTVYGMCVTTFLNLQSSLMEEIATDDAEKFRINKEFFAEVDAVQQNLDVALATINASEITDAEKAQEINLAYSVAIDELIAVMFNFVEDITSNYISVYEYAELQEKQLELLLAIEPALAQYGVVLTESPISLEDCIEFFGNLTEMSVFAQNSAFLFNDFYLEASVNSTEEVMTVVTNYINNVLSAKRLNDLVDENNENIFNLEQDLAQIDTIFDLYLEEANAVLTNGCSSILKFIISSFVESVQEAQQEMYAGNIDFQTAISSVDAEGFAYFVSDEFKLEVDIYTELMLEQVDWLDIANTQQNPLITLTTQQTQTALAFVENFKNTIVHQQDFMVSTFNPLESALEFIGDNGLWAELVFTNFWNAMLDNFFAMHDIDTANLEASLAEKFEAEDADLILEFKDNLAMMLSTAKYAVWVNDELVQEAYENYNDCLLDVAEMIEDGFENYLGNFLTDEEKLLDYKFSASQYIREELLMISTPLLNETYATLVAEYQALKAQIWQAESLDAIDEIVQGFEDVILPSFDDSDAIEAIVFAEYKSMILELLAEFELAVSYLYNAENQESVQTLIDDALLAINNTEVDTKAELDAIANAFENEVEAVETLAEYYAYANLAVDNLIEEMEANKADYDLGNEFADADEFVSYFASIAEVIVLLNDSIADFDTQFAQLTTLIDSYLPTVNP